MEQSVPKRQYIKFRHRGITQQKEYNIQNTAKVWNQENSDYITKRHLSALFIGFYYKAQCVSWWVKNFRFKCYLNFRVSRHHHPWMTESATLQKALLLQKRQKMCVKYGDKEMRTVNTKCKPGVSRPRGCPCFALTFTLFNTRLQRFSGAYKWNWWLNSQGSIQDPRYSPGIGSTCKGLSLYMMLHSIARSRVPDGQRYMQFVSRSRANCLVLLCAQFYYAE
jgi:hypothetical protein